MNDDIEDILLAAPSQQGGVFHSLLDSSESMYVCRIVYDLRGPLDVNCFTSAWSTVFARHEALRSSFEWEELEQVVQVVHRSVELPLAIDDWRALSPSARDVNLSRIDREAPGSFPLNSAPLARLHLILLTDEHARLAFSFHHILLDGWSLHVLTTELLDIYSSLRKNEVPALPPPPLYRTFVRWLAQRDRQADEAYWRALFAAGSPHGRLSVGRRTPTSEYEPRRDFAQASATLPQSLTRTVNDVCRDEHVTLATVCSLAWGLVLARYAGTEDVVFGLTVAHRPSEVAGITEMVGPFFNTVPLRLDLPDEQSTRAALRAVHEATNEQREHVFLSPSEIHRAAGLPGGRALFDTAVRVQTLPRLESNALPSGLQITTTQIVDVWHYPVCFVVEPRADRLDLRIDYDRTQLTVPEAQRLLGHIEMAIAGIVGVDRRLDAIDILTPAERQRALVDWALGEEIESPHVIVEVMAQKARENPEAIVAVAADFEITRGEIQRRSNQFARAFIARGVGLECVVALDPRMQAQAATFVTLCAGVWKAGGALWQLDMRSSHERLRSAATACPVALHVSLDGGGPIFVGVPRVELGTLVAEADAQSSDDFAPRTHAAATAVLTMTSGSTGVPNMVLFPHWAAATLQQSYLKLPALKRGHRVFSPNASSSITQGMISDVVAVLAPPAVLNDPEAFYRFVVEQRVDGFNATAGQLGILDPARVPPMERIIVGGELLPPAVARRWLDHSPIHQHYRSSEGSPGLRGFAGPEYSGEPHVGRPSAGGCAYLLDHRMEPVPVGVVGDIYLGGPALARGYAGQPALTAERFVPDPFSREPGARLYRMGDRGRYYADGRMEFLGRRDRQVKVRGFRVELDEVESRLVEDPAIQRAAVVQTMHPSGDPVLVGYLEAKPSQTIVLDRLREQLRATLPEHMVPPFFVVLDALPTSTESGVVKVMRKQLPPPSFEELREARSAALTTSTEHALAEVWRELLALETLDADDDFFLLGGHSLLVPRLVSAVRTKLGRPLELRTVFDAPTLSAMAAAIDALSDRGDTLPPLPPIVRGISQGALPISPNQVTGLHLLTHRMVEGVTTVALDLRGPLDAGALAGAVRAVHERHEVLRGVFHKGNDGWYHTIDDTMVVPYEVVEARGAIDRDTVVSSVLAGITLAPEGPLWRIVLIRFDDEHAVLVVAMAHLVSDAGSREVLAAELRAHYRRIAGKDPSAPPALPFQYADYARWQLAMHAGERGRAEIAYWRRYLDGAKRFVLPRDETGLPAGTPNEAVTERLALETLRGAVAATQSTPFLFTLGALAIALHAASGLDEIVVNSSHANRHVAGTEHLIGFFTNPLYVRIPLDPALCFTEILVRLKADVMRGREHGNIEIDTFVAHSFDLSIGLNLMYVARRNVSVELDHGLVLSERRAPDALKTDREIYFCAVEVEGAVNLQIGYQPDKFSAGRIVRLTREWRRIAEKAAQRWDATVGELLG